MVRHSPRLWAIFFGGVLGLGGTSAHSNMSSAPHPPVDPARPDHTHVQETISPHEPSRSESMVANGHQAMGGVASVFMMLGRVMPAFLSPMLTGIPMGGWGAFFAFLAIGGFWDKARQWASGSCDRVIKSFYRTVTIDCYDHSFRWMALWLRHQPEWLAAQSMEALTDFDVKQATSEIITDGPVRPARSHQHSGKTPPAIGFMPSANQPCSFWWKGRYVWVQRVISKAEGENIPRSNFVIHMLTRDVNDIRSLIREAGELYMEKKSTSVCTYVSENRGFFNNWRHVGCSPKRSMDSIVLESGIKNLLLEDAREFLKSQDWYNARGIPYRRGYLLYGVPGSGKTSVIHSLAGELGLDVYIISLSRSQLDDNQLTNMINDLPERCIALMEDIDAAFTHDLNRDSPNPTVRMPGPPRREEAGSKVTLSGLLNALDGLGAQEGRILFATTNKYSSLDPALCRPGRMDIHIEFKNATQWQAKELFKQFYRPGGMSAPETESSDSDIEKTGDGEKDAHNVGSGSEDGSGSSVTVLSEWLSATNPSAPLISVDALEDLSSKFSKNVPEGEFSMAFLQGYLMRYKTRPEEAVKNVDEWVEKMRADSRSGEEVEKRKCHGPTVEHGGPQHLPSDFESSECGTTDEETDMVKSESEEEGSEEEREPLEGRPCSRCRKAPKRGRYRRVSPSSESTS